MYVEMAVELCNGRKNFEQEKMPRVPWYTFGNTDVNVSPSEGSEGIEKHGRENIYDLRKYLNCHEQTGDRYVNFKCTTGEGVDGKEEQVIRNQRKDGPCVQWQKA